MSQERKFDNFDEFARNYRNIHNENIKISGEDSDYFAEFKIKWLKKKSKEKNIKFLDFGCGDGTLARWFYNYFPNSSYDGVDISQESINVANERNIPKANFKTFDGHILPYENNSFDSCMAACVFHHIEHNLHSQILEEIRRVLKPGGKFYLWEHNPHNPITRKVVAECEFDKDCVLLKPSYSKSLLKGAKFSKVANNYVIFMPRSKAFKPFVSMEKFLTAVPIGAQYVMIATK